MQIQVKLGGDFRRYAPGEAGGRTLEVEEPLSVSDAMARLGVEEPPEEVLVIVNDEVVPPGERGSVRLQAGDQLALIPQLKGG